MDASNPGFECWLCFGLCRVSMLLTRGTFSMSSSCSIQEVSRRSIGAAERCCALEDVQNEVGQERGESYALLSLLTSDSANLPHIYSLNLFLGVHGFRILCEIRKIVVVISQTLIVTICEGTCLFIRLCEVSKLVCI